MKEVVLREDDPIIFEHLLSYLYTLDYGDGPLLHQDESHAPVASAVRPGPADADQNEEASVSASTDTQLDEEIKSESQLSTLSSDQSASPTITSPSIPAHIGKASVVRHVQVYAMAEKFDIPELKALAKEKFLKCAQGWPLPDFPSVVHEALTSTPESDQGLRGILNEILAEHVEEVCSISSLTLDGCCVATIQKANTPKLWRNALQGEGRFLYNLLSTVAANNVCERERLLMTIQDAQEEMNKLKASVNQLTTQNTHTEQRVDNVKIYGTRLLMEINTRETCRHCHGGFQPWFEDASDWYSGGILRCKLCRTKHSF